MSFDPITLALAKNYTDEKMGSSGGSGSGGGLPVVTINTSADGEYEFAALTEEETAQMEAAAATGMPIVLRMTPQQDITVTLLCYEFFTTKDTNGMIGQYVAKSESDGTGYYVIQKSDFTAPWQIAWGLDLSQMAM